MARYFHNRLSSTPDVLVINEKVLIKRLLNEALKIINEPNSEDELLDAVRDIAVVLTGREIEFMDESQSHYPNGVKSGQNSLIRESKIYEGLPRLVTATEYDKGMVIDYEDY